LDAMLENCIFYISRMYEFSHSLGQSLPTHSAQMPTFVRYASNRWGNRPAQLVDS